MFKPTRRNFGLLALGGAVTAAVATPALAEQGNMENALASLYAALDELRRARGEKGGHRPAAIGLVQQAITETQAGIEFGDNGR